MDLASPRLFQRPAGKTTMEFGILFVRNRPSSVRGHAGRRHGGRLLPERLRDWRRPGRGSQISHRELPHPKSLRSAGRWGPSRLALNAGRRSMRRARRGRYRARSQLSLRRFQSGRVSTRHPNAVTFRTSFIPTGGGDFIFDNGSGGQDVGRFNASLNAAAAFTWTNAAAITLGAAAHRARR